MQLVVRFSVQKTHSFIYLVNIDLLCASCCLRGKTYSSEWNKWEKLMLSWHLHSIEGNQVVNMLTDAFIICQREVNKHYGEKWTSWRRGLPFFMGCSRKALMIRDYLRAGLMEVREEASTYLEKTVPKQRDPKKWQIFEAGVCSAPREGQRARVTEVQRVGSTVGDETWEAVPGQLTWSGR